MNASIHSGEIDAAAQDALPERIDRKVAWVREGAGDRFDDLELNARLAIAEVTDARVELAEMLAAGFGTDADTLLGSPLTLTGAPSSRVGTSASEPVGGHQ